jgi:hypothetical protein
MTKFSSCLSSLVFGRTRAGGSFLFQESLDHRVGLLLHRDSAEVRRRYTIAGVISTGEIRVDESKSAVLAGGLPAPKATGAERS